MKWEYNSDSFKNWLLSELTLDVKSQISNWTKENKNNLSFNNLFKNNQTRIVIPLADVIANNILSKLYSIGEIDFDNGAILVGKNKIRLGKYILNKKSPFTEEEKQWWIHQGDPFLNLKIANENKNYSVVISRSPLDVVRMSDHDGWSSCHSQGMDYFKCAVSDAKGAGAIAYIVNNEDLKNIDLNSEEIFKDKKRNIDGITPISRLRIRKFVHKKEGYELAIPEDRIYGKKITALEDVVKQWAKDNQSAIVSKRPKLDEFKLMGGSYQDTLASNLFNNFFDDDEDSGDVEYGGDEEDYQNIINQMEQELEEIKNNYDFKYFNIYAEVEGEEDPYIIYSGSINIEIPYEFISERGIRTFGNTDKRFWANVNTEIKNWARNNDIYNINDIDINGGEVIIHVYGDGSHIDDFKSFADDLSSLEDKYDDLQKSLYNLFVDLGLAHSNKTHELINNLNQENEHDYNLKYFKWEVEDEHNAQASLKFSMGVMPEVPSSNYYTSYGYWISKFEKMFRDQFFGWAEKAHNHQPSLFGDKNIPPFNFNQKIQPIIKISLLTTIGKTEAIFNLMVNFHSLNNNQEFYEAIELLQFIERNIIVFEKMVINIHKLILSESNKALRQSVR